MATFRTHGTPPWRVAVVHGGPGACGDLSALARRLSPGRGVLEPWCVGTSVDAQVDEIEATLSAAGADRVVTVGHSWGAWIATLHAVRRPERVAGVVWIGCPPFDTADAASILPTRLARLGEAERAEVLGLWSHLSARPGVDMTAAFARIGRIFARADAHDPIEEETGAPPPRVDVFRAVWSEAAALRVGGGLRRALSGLRRPVVAFHGEQDPHPVEAIAAVGATLTSGFRLHRYADCGHRPWCERAARDTFLADLERELDRLGGSGARTITIHE